MQSKKFLPLVDKLFFIISVPTVVLMIVMTVLSLEAPLAFVLLLLCDALVVLLLVSPLFGYVELREKTVLIRYGIFLKREIEYSKIRSLERRRSVCSESMLSLKNSLEHVNIKYNKFDQTSVSVKNNDELIREIKARISAKCD